KIPDPAGQPVQLRVRRGRRRGRQRLPRAGGDRTGPADLRARARADHGAVDDNRTLTPWRIVAPDASPGVLRSRCSSGRRTVLGVGSTTPRTRVRGYEGE